jgi:hypothetical protein
MHIGFIYFPYVCKSRAKLSLSTAFKLFFLVNRDANHPYHRLQFIFLIYIFKKESLAIAVVGFGYRKI